MPRLIDDPLWGKIVLVDSQKLQEILDKIEPLNVVPIVRCKDCKHSKHWYRDKNLCFLWSKIGVNVFDDGFCNYGEREEE